MLEMRMDAHVENVVDLFVEYRFRQSKSRNLAEHKPAALVLFIEQMNFVTERCQVSPNCQRSRPGSDQRDLLSVRLKRRLRHQVFYFVLIVGGDALEAANRNRFFIDASAAASRFTRPVT